MGSIVTSQLCFICREIYDKIDTDKDSQVTEKELKDWIQHVQFRYVEEDTERQWEEQDVSQDGTLTWEAYKQRTYGFMDGRWTQQMYLF